MSLSKSQFGVRQITFAAIIGAAYTALSLLGAIFSISYGPIQCRFSEALTLLPFFFPEATLGLFIGCLITNVISPYGPLDMIFGSLATLLAALWTARCASQKTAAIPPVLCNAVILGVLFSWQSVGFGPGFWAAFGFNALTVGIGQALACFVLGGLLLRLLPKIPTLRRYIPEAKL